MTPRALQAAGPGLRSVLFIRAADGAIQGLRQLAAYRLRTLLALSGIVVGVAAVVGSRMLIAGTEEMVHASFREMGGMQVGTIRSGFERWKAGRVIRLQKRFPLERADAEALRKQLPEIEEIAMLSWGATSIQAPHVRLPSENVIGVSSSYLRIRTAPVIAGRFFTPEEDEGAERVVVMFQRVATELLGGPKEAVGRELLIAGQRFLVVGVAQTSASWPGMARRVVIPFGTSIRRLGRDPDDAAMQVRLRPGSSFKEMEPMLRAVLMARHPGSVEDNFSAWSPGEWMGNVLKSVHALGRILASIAALCLLAGGVGIMNVFLISVTERTLEIGLRMALGASRRAVLCQILFEAVVLCAIGGAVGLGGAMGLARLFGKVMDQMATEGPAKNATVSISFGPADAMLGLSMAVGVAVLFASFPAWRAARNDPATSLRRE